MNTSTRAYITLACNTRASITREYYTRESVYSDHKYIHRAISSGPVKIQLVNHSIVNIVV